jgi:SAM-dependent methyltransferase
MGIKLQRIKKKEILLSVFYKLNKLIPFSAATKLKWFLNLEWLFERMSHEYSFKNFTDEEHPLRKFTREQLLEWIKPDDVILDLGCHEGKMSAYMAEKAKQVVGIDYNNVAIEEAKKTYKKDNLSFHCVEAYDYLTTTSIKFDVLILSHILEHLDNPDEFLQKFAPFFKYVYIELPDFDKTYLNHYRKKLNLSLIYTDADHITEFDRIELKKVIENNNLKIINTANIYGLHKVWCEVIK